jgi:hypothetical protein
MDRLNNIGKLTISERRQTYPFEDRLKMYSPEKLAKQLEEKEAVESKLMVNGVNLLNKRNMDCDVAIDRMKRRKEMHNRVERQRRDCLNQLMDELIELVPDAASETRGKSHHRANGLRKTAQYIRELHKTNVELQMDNMMLREQCRSVSPPDQQAPTTPTSPGIVRPVALRYSEPYTPATPYSYPFPLYAKYGQDNACPTYSYGTPSSQ